jgi:hypothetical protein
VIEKILPDLLACSEAFDDPLDAVLFPEEEAVISRAVEKRRREFRTVWLCARRALRELNLLQDIPVLIHRPPQIVPLAVDRDPDPVFIPEGAGLCQVRYWVPDLPFSFSPPVFGCASKRQRGQGSAGRPTA